MPVTFDPRTYVQSKPLPIASHQGLRITARSTRPCVYTCEYPRRKKVAQENYQRRAHQMTRCGYRSVSHKPYQPIGDVLLDDKTLILSALGQLHSQENNNGNDDDSQSTESDSDDEDAGVKSAKDKEQPIQMPQYSERSKSINNISAQVQKGRAMMSAVRLGFGLFRLIREEQEKKQEQAEKERRKKEQEEKGSMLPPTYESDSDSDEETDIKKFMIPAPSSPTRDLEEEDNAEDDQVSSIADVFKRSVSPRSRARTAPSTALNQWQKIKVGQSGDLKSVSTPVMENGTGSIERKISRMEAGQEGLAERKISRTENSSAVERKISRNGQLQSREGSRISFTTSGGGSSPTQTPLRKVSRKESPTTPMSASTSITIQENQERSQSPTQTLSQKRSAASQSPERMSPSPVSFSPTLTNSTKPKSGKSTSSSGRKGKKLRGPRPFTPVYTNINYPTDPAIVHFPKEADKESIFRQLCALNWILEAMEQDQQPPVMPSITHCWNIKDLNLDTKAIKKRAEKEKMAEDKWKTFRVNPERFTQSRNVRKFAGTRKISIHPTFLQRLSAQTSSSTSPTPPMGRSGRRSSVVSFADTVDQQTDDTTSTTERSQRAPSPANTIASGIGGDERTPTTLGQNTPGPGTPAPPSTPATPKSGGEPKKLTKQKSFTINTIYQHPTQQGKKALQRVKTKTKAARAFRNSLSQEDVSKLSTVSDESQARQPDSRVRAWVQQTGNANLKNKFAAAAIATFGAITIDSRVEKIPDQMKSKFSEVQEEKSLVLHDNLEILDRNRLQKCERKLRHLHTSNNMYKSLESMRARSAIPDIETETHEEMRLRVVEECEWYKDLMENLSTDVKEDRYCMKVLNKIAQHGSLEGRKISASHFLKVLSSLEVWQLCSPDVSAAIEFVRHKVVGMTEDEHEEWLQAKLQHKAPSLRAMSAPPSTARTM